MLPTILVLLPSSGSYSLVGDCSQFPFQTDSQPRIFYLLGAAAIQPDMPSTESWHLPAYPFSFACAIGYNSHPSLICPVLDIMLTIGNSGLTGESPEVSYQAYFQPWVLHIPAGVVSQSGMTHSPVLAFVGTCSSSCLILAYHQSQLLPAGAIA